MLSLGCSMLRGQQHKLGFEMNRACSGGLNWAVSCVTLIGDGVGVSPSFVGCCQLSVTTNDLHYRGRSAVCPADSL